VSIAFSVVTFQNVRTILRFMLNMLGIVGFTYLGSLVRFILVVILPQRSQGK